MASAQSGRRLHFLGERLPEMVPETLCKDRLPASCRRPIRGQVLNSGELAAYCEINSVKFSL